MGYNPPVVRKTWLKRFKKVHKKGEFKYNKSANFENFKSIVRKNKE